MRIALAIVVAFWAAVSHAADLKQLWRLRSPIRTTLTRSAH